MGQGRGRGQARQKARAGRGGRGQDFLVEWEPGRQPGAVGEKARQGQGTLVRRQPRGREDLSQGGGDIKLAPGRQDHQGQGRGQGLRQGGQVEDRVQGHGRGTRLPGDGARGPLPAELSLKPHQGRGGGKDALADAGFEKLLQGSVTVRQREASVVRE